MKKILIILILSFLTTVTFSPWNAVAQSPGGQGVITKASPSQPCKTDYDCRSDGSYNCGKPVDPMISSRQACCCYGGECIEYHKMNKIIQTENWPVKECQSKFDSIDARDMCIRAVASSKKDYLLCKQSSDPIISDACIRDVAVATQDVSLCEHTKHEWRHGLCVVYVARDLQDASLCQNLTGQSRGFCFDEVAVATNDLKLCDESGEYKSGCVDQIEKKTKNKGDTHK